MVVVPVDMVVDDRFDVKVDAVGWEDGAKAADTDGRVRVGQGGGGGSGGTCICICGDTTETDGGVVVIVVVVVVTIAAGVQSPAVVDADRDDIDDGFFGTSSTSACCIMSRLRQLSAMLSRFFQMVATVLLARPSSRATSLLLLPRSIS